MSKGASSQPAPMGKTEFVVLTAMMFAIIAFSVDSMLPALSEIGAELSPDAPNRGQLILTSFILGMGVGTFFAGPLSDTFGRKPVIMAGAALYCVASAVAWASSSLEVVLAARVVQGLGAAGPRVVSVAIVRDLFAGREMAKIMSIAMLIFTIVPALAPLMGAAIIAFSGWRGIFVAFILFISTAMVWHKTRLPESLAVEDRRPFRWVTIKAALLELYANPTVRLSILVQTLTFAMLFVMITLVQPIFEQVFDRAESFPWWFGGIAILAGSASALNAALVIRFGMRRLVTISLGCMIALSVVMLVLNSFAFSDPVEFTFFLIVQLAVFFMAGMTIGNLNAIAMEPVGHIAGIAASAVGGISTVLSAILAAPVGLMFNGTVLPLLVSLLLYSGIAFALMLRMNAVEAAEGR
jgi:DHA1 family bicyclomycin/chloramphenicol resistance-like MFS transporter